MSVSDLNVRSYRDAGVDLDRAAEITARIGDRVGSGLFGGFLPVSRLKSFDAPVLVTSIDGVGTKVRLAAALERTAGLGRDLVHHCVNDIAVHGATPLCFLDYLAFNRLDPTLVDGIVAVIASACADLDILLAGGETAEMPLVYPPGHFDIAGAIVGVVEQAEIIDGSAITAGDVVLGLPSSGLHTSGYSLVQGLFSDEDYRQYQPALGMTLGNALLEPHRCYLHEITELRATGFVRGLAHITGGGIVANLGRVIPDGLTAVLTLPESLASDRTAPLFQILVSRGVATEEMARVFNLGIGLIAVCAPSVLAGPLPVGTHILGEVTTSAVGPRGPVSGGGKVLLQ